MKSELPDIFFSFRYLTMAHPANAVAISRGIPITMRKKMIITDSFIRSSSGFNVVCCAETVAVGVDTFANTPQELALTAMGFLLNT